MKKYALACAAAALALSAQCLNAEIFELKSPKAQIKIDDKGNLVSLKNLEKNREYAGGEGLWRIIYQDGLSLEESVESENVPVKVSKDGGKITLEYGGEFPVNVACSLDGDEIAFSSEIKNASKDKILREFQFPIIKSAKIKKDTVLYWASASGTKIPDVRKWLMGGFKSYMAQDNKAIERYDVYPSPMSLNYFVLDDGDCALYFANHDPNFEKTLHLFRTRKIGGRGDFEYGGIDAAMAKYPFLKAGESKKFADFVVAPHSGDWHVSAKKYRKWADTWYKHIPIAETFRKSNGWQRIIMRHQYGKVLFRYDQLPEIRKAGKKAGIDTILMFGWWKEGMDAGYPEYTPDDTQGGDEALKKWIKEFQKDGGKVNLYYNGQLIDMGTNFYRTLGKKISVKRADGTEHMERYPFGGDGTALRVFGNKTFVTACPATREWLEILKKLADRAIALGADGVFFDQLGFKSELCYDESHGHSIPAQDIMKYKHNMLKELRAYVRSKKPDMSMGIEWVSDPTSMYADYIHAVSPNLYITHKDKNGVPATNYAPMYYYTFPEVYTTNRDIYNNQNVPFRCNLTFMRGWREDAAVYRCRATLDETPVYQAYLAKIDALRDKFRDTVLNGAFRDTDLAKSSNPNMYYSTFENDRQVAVVAMHPHAKTVETAFEVPNCKFVESGGIGDFKVEGDGSKAKVGIGKDGIAVLLFEKK